MAKRLPSDLRRAFIEFMRQQSSAPLKLTRRPDTGRLYGNTDSDWIVERPTFTVPDFLLESKPRSKKRRNPRTYDHDMIRRVAEASIKEKGLPRSCEKLMSQVTTKCDESFPRVPVPERTQLQTILSPVFKRADAKRKKAKRQADKLK